MTTKLPNTLHGLLRVGLDDVAKCEALPDRFVIDMDDWHQIDSNGEGRDVCLVCVAGSVMAQTLGMPDDKELDPGHFNKDTCQKLEALDYLREGMVAQAANEMPGYPDDLDKFCVFNVTVTPYERSPTQWRQDMEELYMQLFNAGI